MRAVGMTWRGLDTFQTTLAAMPEAVQAEADQIFQHAADTARVEIIAAYPIGPGSTRYGPGGRLKRGVIVRPPRGQEVGTQLVQTAPHGGLYEFGTKPRQTRKGYNRGSMPRTRTFYPIANRYRYGAVQTVIRQLYSHGAARVIVAA